ncbi:MAG: DUF4124 domain-containing protein [Candidatus Dadabacteria bacterium]|nr:MAG: DUF4124 domain-containing protein [Candidatus Dadabacteria bacterium]
MYSDKGYYLTDGAKMEKLLLTILAFLCLNGIAAAQDIYSWTDEHGVVHYSTKKGSSNAKVAKLPKINRGEYKLEGYRETASPDTGGRNVDTAAKGGTEDTSCDSHGGIDCAAGKDSDGSVICSDGYKGATARYKFECSRTRLRIADVSMSKANGSVTVYVRNERSVTAKNPIVTYHGGYRTSIRLYGPSEIKPYEMAQFRIGALKLGKNPSLGKSKFSVTCDNCS